MDFKSYLAPSRWIFLAFWLSLWVNTLDAAPVGQVDLKSVFTDPVRAWSSKTTISFKNSANFVDATERWTIFDPPTYTAAIRPGTEEDVIKTLKLATTFKIPFLATGGRHGYTTTIGDLHDGLAIDLSHLNSVKIDKKAETVTVGPGTIMDDVLDPLYDAGFMIQTGTAYCPSIIGVTLGGGVGRFTGLFGLMLDALVSVRIVTADGKLVEASQSSNPELFWAIRGAGANFGIITSATYKVHALPKIPNSGNIYTVDFIFPANMSAQFYNTVESMNDKLPAEMAGISFINYNTVINQTQVMANWVYMGTEQNGRRALAPVFDLGTPISSRVVTWNKLINSTFDGLVAKICQPGFIKDIYSLNLKNYSASTYNSIFDKMSDFYDKYPGGRRSAVQLEFYSNQAMKGVSADTTAWPWRDATGYLNAAMSWNKGDQVTAKAAMALGRELRDEVAVTSGYSDLSVFINYARGDEKLEQIYSREKLPRLARLKRKYDPNHFFSYNNGLPTHYP